MSTSNKPSNFGSINFAPRSGGGFEGGVSPYSSLWTGANPFVREFTTLDRIWGDIQDELWMNFDGKFPYNAMAPKEAT